jgi:hypothetical protein
VSGAGNRAGSVVSVSSRADDRRIADAPEFFIRHSAGRSRRGDAPKGVERDRADRSELFFFKRLLDYLRLFKRMIELNSVIATSDFELLESKIRLKIFIRFKDYFHFSGEFVGAASGE